MGFEHDFTKLGHDGSHYVTIICVTSYHMISLYDGQCEIMGVISCPDRDSSIRGQKRPFSVQCWRRVGAELLEARGLFDPCAALPESLVARLARFRDRPPHMLPPPQ